MKNEVTTVISMISRGRQQSPEASAYRAGRESNSNDYFGATCLGLLRRARSRAGLFVSRSFVLVIGPVDKDGRSSHVIRETRTKIRKCTCPTRRQGARPKATLARANRDSELMSHGETAIRFLPGHRLMYAAYF